jgi:hypothetical protein
MYTHTANKLLLYVHCIYASIYLLKCDFKLIIYILTCICDSRRGFGLHIRFIDHFNARLVSTLNYSAIVNFQILQITPEVFSSPQCLH